MDNRNYFLFLIGMVAGYLFLAPAIAIHTYTAYDPSEYHYVKHYSRLNYSKTIENNDFHIQIFVESPSPHAYRTDDYVWPPGSDLPYFITLSITSIKDESQWVVASEEFLVVELWENSKKGDQIISISDSYAPTMGIFLAPYGKHEVTSIWLDRGIQKTLSDGLYELVLRLRIQDNEQVFGVFFSVETELEKLEVVLV